MNAYQTVGDSFVKLRFGGYLPTSHFRPELGLRPANLEGRIFGDQCVLPFFLPFLSFPLSPRSYFPLFPIPTSRGGGCRGQRNTAKRPLTNSRGDIISRSRAVLPQLTSVYGWICPAQLGPLMFSTLGKKRSVTRGR